MQISHRHSGCRAFRPEAKGSQTCLRQGRVLADRTGFGVFRKGHPLRGPEREKKLSKGKIAIMRKFLLLLAVSALAINVAYPQSPGADSARQVKAGEVVTIGSSLFVRVTKSTKSFEGVKVKGAAFVVDLEMDAGKLGATLSYKLTANPGSSEIYLVSGAQKLAPRAVVEDFPSWGTDNDKEVETLDPKDTIGGVTLTFQRKGSISLLFDVPLEEAKTPKKLSVVLRMVQPKDDQRSFVATL